MTEYEDRPEDEASALEFTYWARERFYQIADDPYFRTRETDLIYASLRQEIRIVPFGDYLKRYIFEKAGLSGAYTEVPLNVYLDTICSEFADRQTPCAFRSTTVRLRNAARNWLEQQSVKRSVVLILGFGLGMGETDVNDFLTKALQEPALNAKDPFEAICWYCFREGLSFDVFEDLWTQYRESAQDAKSPADDLESTISFYRRFSEVETEEQLMAYLAGLPVVKGTRRQSVTARKQFVALYCGAQNKAAQILTESEMDNAVIRAERLQEALSRQDRFSDAEKLQRIHREKADYKAIRPEAVTPADLENILFAAVPRDGHGNMLSLSDSTLNELFDGKRLSRQRIREIQQGNAPITRYDLMTLNFFILSQEDYASPRKRYSDFIESTNRILQTCGMGKLYVANPYECFLLMCMLTEAPLSTYADVWELSYDPS